MPRTPISVTAAALNRRKVRFVLMGGQACVLHGVNQFTEDVDVAIDPAPDNLVKFRAALRDLRAKPVYFPRLSREFLLRGHACHFRCVMGEFGVIRLDAMSVMRNAPPFEKLWENRHTVRLKGGPMFDLMSLRDLVQVKKTMREKDWPMIALLIEADYDHARRTPDHERILFWLREARSVEFLGTLVRRFRSAAREAAASRPAVRHAIGGNVKAAQYALRRERAAQERADREYWEPLLRELEKLRLARKRK